MTDWRDPSFDSRVADWLELDPSTAPPAVLDGVLAKLPSIAQRRRGLWPGGGRIRPMTDLMKLAAGAGAALAIVAIALAVSSEPAGGPGAAPASPSAAGTLTPAPRSEEPTPPATSAASASPDGVPDLGAARGLSPGTYRTDLFTPTLELTVASEGWAVGDQFGGSLNLFRMPRNFMEIMRVVQVVDEAGTTGPVPDDLATWLAERPDLRVESTEGTTIDGRDGTIVTARVDDSARPDGGNHLQLGVSAAPFVPIRVWRDATFRAIVIETEAEPLLIVIHAPDSERVAFDALADDVLASLRFVDE